MGIKVVKFGGSSLADANQFRKVADIVLADPDRRFVVASAPGKRFSDDIKVTDMLYACYAKAAEGGDFAAEFAAIEERYNGIISELGLDISLEKEFTKIKNAFEHRAGRDYAASRGEYLNSIVLAASSSLILLTLQDTSSLLKMVYSTLKRQFLFSVQDLQSLSTL